MKKKRIIFIALLLLIATVLAIQLLSPKQPSYQSKTLTEWLRKYEADHSASGQADCEHAIIAIGTNGIPALLKLLTSSEFGSSRLQPTIESLGWTNLHTFDASYNRRLATIGFLTLGQTAKSAMPKLIELSHSSRSPVTRLYAVWCLEVMKTDKEILLSLWTQLLSDPDPDTAKLAAEQLYRLSPAAAQKTGADKLLSPVNTFQRQRTRVK